MASIVPVYSHAIKVGAVLGGSVGFLGGLTSGRRDVHPLHAGAEGAFVCAIIGTIAAIILKAFTFYLGTGTLIGVIIGGAIGAGSPAIFITTVVGGILGAALS